MEGKRLLSLSLSLSANIVPFGSFTEEKITLFLKKIDIVFRANNLSANIRHIFEQTNNMMKKNFIKIYLVKQSPSDLTVSSNHFHGYFRPFP